MFWNALAGKLIGKGGGGVGITETTLFVSNLVSLSLARLESALAAMHLAIDFNWC